MRFKIYKLLNTTSIVTVIATPLIAVACSNDAQNEQVAPVQPDILDSLKKLEKSIEVVLSNNINYDLLPSFEEIKNNVTVYKDKLVNVVSGVLKIPGNSDKAVENLNSIIMNLMSSESQNNPTNLATFIFNFVIQNINNINDTDFGIETNKDKNDLVAKAQNLLSDDLVLGLTEFNKIATIIKDGFFDGSSDEIETLQKDIMEAIDEQNKKKIVDDASRSMQQKLSQRTETLLRNSIPRISERSPSSLGWSNINDIGNGSADFDINNISSAGNDAVFITPSTSENSNSSFLNSGILYIPNEQNKLNVLTPNFQRLLDSFKTLSEEAEKQSDPTSQRNKLFYDEKVRYYTNVLKNVKNPTDLINNRLIASHLNALDLKNKYILRVTRRINISTQMNNPSVNVTNFGVKDLKINKDTKKIDITISVVDKNNKIFLQRLSRILEPFSISNNGINSDTLTQDFYIPINKSEFDEVFLNGKDAISASKDSNIDLDLSQIIEFKAE